MKNLLKRMSAILLALMIVISLVPNTVLAAQISTTATGYTQASDVDYKTGSNGWIYNWGARGETCVFLSSKTASFYTGSNTFDALSKLTGGSSQSNAPQSALYSSLAQLMKSKHTKINNYDQSKAMFAYTDCVSNNTSKLSSFYSGTMVASVWSSGGSVWNREHTWPNSKGMNGRDEDDIMMLRPTIPSENGSRGNTAYGEGSGYFDPGTSTRGDVARIALYVYVRWGNTGSMWGKSGVIESMDILLKWMKEDPVDTWEMGRNDAVQSITGTRNVFVDYPEFAWLLFGKDVPAGITTPSDNDGVTANPGGNSGSGNSGNSGSGNSGSSGSTTDTSYTKVSSLNDGDKIIIVNPASNMALSMNKISTYYNAGVDVSGGFGGITNAEIFTVKKNSDGSYSFTSESGKKLALADEKNSLNDAGTNDKWELSSAGSNQFYLKNTVRNVYLDWYAEKGNWSTYAPSSLTADYVLAFYVKTASGNNSGNNSGSSSGNSNGGSTNTNPPATNPPATNPPATNPPAGETTPPASDPSNNEGAQTTTPNTTPEAPVPMETVSVNPNDFLKKDTEDDDSDSTLIIIFITVGAVAAGIIIYIIVAYAIVKPKKKTIAAPDTAAAEAPVEEGATDSVEGE